MPDPHLEKKKKQIYEDRARDDTEKQAKVIEAERLRNIEEREIRRERRERITLGIALLALLLSAASLYLSLRFQILL